METACCTMLGMARGGVVGATAGGAFTVALTRTTLSGTSYQAAVLTGTTVGAVGGAAVGGLDAMIYKMSSRGSVDHN